MQKKMYLQDDRPKILTILEWLAQIAVICALGLFIAQFFFFSTETVSRSMEPTVKAGSVVFVNQTAYLLQEPQRFDVIAFYREETKTDQDVLVRRIIALPGETIQIVRGKVYIDGEILDVSGYCTEITSEGIAAKEIRLGDNEYFVLGDSAANSEDSRSQTLGLIKRSRILGKAWCDYLSLLEVQLIH